VPGHGLVAVGKQPVEQAIQPQQPPEVPGQEDLTKVARPFPAHGIEPHLDHALARWHPRLVTREEFELALLTRAAQDRNALAPGRFARAVQLAQIRKRPMLRTARRPHRLDERVVAVSLAVLRSRVRLQKHRAQSA
jgi:hypothetical protein